jgi:two-component system, NtrC family, sensor kinase
MSQSNIANVEGETLSARVIHEIEGRLATIAIFSEELARQGEQLGPAKLLPRLSRIHLAATETLRVIDAVKRLNEDSPIERVNIDLSALCSQILERRSALSPHFASLSVRIQPNIQIRGDLDQVGILLDNLIGNALKFTARCTSPEVRVTVSSESNRSVIHVSDNGIGITPEDAERMFQLFTRCHSNFAGTGVGLATARRVVERHGGRIWATGKPGLGTTVSFFLPN